MDGSSLSQREVRRDFSWLERLSPAQNPPNPPFLKGDETYKDIISYQISPTQLREEPDIKALIARLSESENYLPPRRKARQVRMGKKNCLGEILY
jgi:hypothetical protein